MGGKLSTEWRTFDRRSGWGVALGKGAWLRPNCCVDPPRVLLQFSLDNLSRRRGDNERSTQVGYLRTILLAVLVPWMWGGNERSRSA